MNGGRESLVGAILIAALNTFGDFVWARFIPAHRALFGLGHGIVLCMAIGAYLGALQGEGKRGAGVGAAIGLCAAAGFYALAPLLGWAAMFVLWMALWAAFAWSANGSRGSPRAGSRATLGRALLATIGSGAAFYAVSGIWTRPRPGGPDYAYNFLCWAFAFLPGFLALLLGSASRRENG